MRRRLLAPLFLAKSSAFSLNSAAAPLKDAVAQIIGHFNCSPFRYSHKLLLDCLRTSNWFRNEVPKLEPPEIDSIIERIGSHSAIEFFFLLQNEFGFKHSENSQFVVAHLLAEKSRSRALQCHLQMVIQEKGNLQFFMAMIVLF